VVTSSCSFSGSASISALGARCRDCLEDRDIHAREALQRGAQVSGGGHALGQEVVADHDDGRGSIRISAIAGI